MILSLIAAMSENRVIGREGKLPWYLPEDLKRFRKLTLGHVVIMGRKTYESIGKPLPNRTNIILTKQTNYHALGTRIEASIEKALSGLSGEVFIIGGGEVYQQALPRADRIYLTLVHTAIEGDTFFPETHRFHFQEKERETYPGSPSYSFIRLEKA
jgi:dihydrofolate reductase